MIFNHEFGKIWVKLKYKIIKISSTAIILQNIYIRLIVLAQINNYNYDHCNCLMKIRNK